MTILDQDGNDTAPVRIAILIPTHDMVPSGFMYDLASLVMYTTNVLPVNTEMGILMVQGTYVHSAREDLIRAALEQDATFALWLDSDHRFPKDALVRLLQREKPVVGVNYAQRAVPTDFVALEKVDYEGKEGSTRLFTGPESTGLVEVDAMGFGMVLMRLSALRNMPDPNENAWFWFRRLEDGRVEGEDVYFSRLLRESGEKLYVDQDLSQEIYHIGQFEYKNDHAAINYEKAG